MSRRLLRLGFLRLEMDPERPCGRRERCLQEVRSRVAGFSGFRSWNAVPVLEAQYCLRALSVRRERWNQPKLPHHSDIIAIGEVLDDLAVPHSKHVDMLHFK
jgi:hypothetical protein